jgi:hypothetical protein
LAYFRPMAQNSVYFTQRSAESFRSVIYNLQEVSLLSAERVRSKILHKLHLIQHEPLQASKKIELQNLEGHFRLATILNYKIYYQVQDDNIYILEFLLDKNARPAT